MSASSHAFARDVGAPRARMLAYFPFAPHAVLSLALLTALGCGGGDGTTPGGGITPPPTDNTVASVTVSPTSATVQVQATAQLTAAALTASGATLSGKSFTWTVGDAAVATVSNGGVLTGVSVGVTTVSAAVDGKSGSAQVTVTPSATQVIVSASVGPTGGTLGTSEVAISVPAGGLTDTRTLQLHAADVAMHPVSAYATGSQFRLSGFPTDRDVTVSVRLKAPASTDGANLIGMRVPAVTTSDTIQVVSRMYPARDSAGWIVADVNVRGIPASLAGMSARAAVAALNGGPYPDILDGVIFGVKSADTLRTAHFLVTSYGAPRAQLQPMLASLAQYLEESYTAVQGMGYGYAHRKTWPLPVSLHPIPEEPNTFAFFARNGGFPLSTETGWFEFNATKSGLAAAMPGVGIHEFFHFTQAQFNEGSSQARFESTGWLKEATASWIMERAPSNVMATKNTFFRGWRDSLFTGIYPGLTPSGGYGKGALIKYIADRWGDGKVRDIFNLMGTGISAEDAFVNAMPVASTTWWPDFLTAYMTNQVYSLSLGELLPANKLLADPHPGATFITLGWGYPASARVTEFRFDTAKIASGADVAFRFAGTDSTSFKVMAFQADPSGVWKSLGPAADTLTITGTQLRKNLRIILVTVRPDVTAPLSTPKWTSLRYDMGLREGDWFPDKVTNVSDHIVYTSTKASDSTRIDVASHISSVSGLFASGGYWKRDATPAVGYTWTPYPGVSDTLARYGIVMSSTLTKVAGATAWSYVMTNKFQMGASAFQSLRSSRGLPSRDASWLWYLVPIGLIPLAAKKRTRRVGVLAMLFITVGLVACDVGSISFGGKFTYEFQLPEAAVRYSAAANDSTVPVLTYPGVTGKFIVDEYRSEYWDYVKNDKGEKIDSVRQLRTAVGNATFTYDGMLYHDGKIPSDESERAIKELSKLLQVSPAVVREHAGVFLRKR